MVSENAPATQHVVGDEKCVCARCGLGLPHTPTLEEFQALQAENWALEAAITEHDSARAELSREHEVRQLVEWQTADADIKSLRAELNRVTALGAQWAQEREDAREQLGREMATVDDMTKDVAALEGVVAKVHRLLRPYLTSLPSDVAQAIEYELASGLGSP